MQGRCTRCDASVGVGRLEHCEDCGQYLCWACWEQNTHCGCLQEESLAAGSFEKRPMYRLWTTLRTLGYGFRPRPG